VSARSQGERGKRNVTGSRIREDRGRGGGPTIKRGKGRERPAITNLGLVENGKHGGRWGFRIRGESWRDPILNDGGGAELSRSQLLVGGVEFLRKGDLGESQKGSRYFDWEQRARWGLRKHGRRWRLVHRRDAGSRRITHREVASVFKTIIKVGASGNVDFGSRIEFRKIARSEDPQL